MKTYVLLMYQSTAFSSEAGAVVLQCEIEEDFLVHVNLHPSICSPSSPYIPTQTLDSVGQALAQFSRIIVSNRENIDGMIVSTSRVSGEGSVKYKLRD